MQRKHMHSVLMNLGLGVMLTVGLGTWGVTSAAAQTSVQPYTGQIREIKIDQCGLEAGTCSGSLVLAQARGQEVELAIPAGTLIQRGGQRVYLAELAIGNYVRVQATPLSPLPQGSGRNWTWGEIDAYQRSPVISGAQGE